MQLYDFREWIRVEYWNGEVEYVKTLPNKLIDIFIISYISNGMLHREGGPAKTHYNDRGDVIDEYYFLNNRLHRKNGAARVVYNIDGTIKHREYYLNGQLLFKISGTIFSM